MNKFENLFVKQKTFYNTDITKDYEWRIEQLDQLSKMLKENTDDFYQAVAEDYKTALPEFVLEVNAPLNVIEFTKSQLSSWMMPQEAVIPKFLEESGHKGLISQEPYGVTLVIGPFNAPIISLLLPAIAAISAGNTVILKTHEATPATSNLLKSLIPKYFAEEALSVISGGKEAVTELLKLPFDFIFFTGSEKVGKIVMRAAAENLTPVILELGGQNPAIVDETANISDAAKKLVWGATAWGGQWCTSPGYVYVHESIAAEFVEAAKKSIVALYGSDPKNNPDFSKIISPSEVKRLASMIDPDKVIVGGESDEMACYIDPTLMYPSNWSDKIMKGEIFGPILPILTYKDINEVISAVKKAPKPLAAYIFSKNQATVNHLLKVLPFGGGAVNQTNIHLYIVTMPFGGVGNSGIGKYYGRHGFDSLTHSKSVLISPPDVSIDHLFAPYTMEKAQDLQKWFEY